MEKTYFGIVSLSECNGGSYDPPPLRSLPRHCLRSAEMKNELGLSSSSFCPQRQVLPFSDEASGQLVAVAIPVEDPASPVLTPIPRRSLQLQLQGDADASFFSRLVFPPLFLDVACALFFGSSSQTRIAASPS